jgi:hypothetical protein
MSQNEFPGQSKAFSKSNLAAGTGMSTAQKADKKPEGKGILKMTNEPRDIPKRERFNPALNETFEAVGPHLSN